MVENAAPRPEKPRSGDRLKMKNEYFHGVKPRSGDRMVENDRLTTL
jgi:hypothetical protein